MTLLSPGGLAIVFLVCAVWIWRFPHSRPARRAALAAAIAYLLASIYVVPAAIAAILMTRGAARFDRKDLAGRGTAIVLLGGGSQHVHGEAGTLSLMFPAEAARVLEAARVFALVDPEWIISSGGADPLDEAPSSIVMRDALVQLGVPPNRIVLESTSRDTHDEAILIAPLLKSLRVRHTILVTSAIHMPRSLGAFRAAGIAASPAPAIDPGALLPPRQRWLPTLQGLVFSAQVAHECIGLPYYAARGWWIR
ncbi:MAG TPA: YdcF family protein [Vicinamibacterales bacterium]|nr:YdcF family protein [Vicinamibacterales bacterium]